MDGLDNFETQKKMENRIKLDRIARRQVVTFNIFITYLVFVVLAEFFAN